MAKLNSGVTVSCIDPISAAIASGNTALLVTGNIYDLQTSRDSEIAFRPQELANRLHDAGFTIIRYSKSQGGRIHGYSTFPPKEKELIDSRLNAVGLLNLLNRDAAPNNPDEIKNFFRSIARLLQIPSNGQRSFALVVEYCEHLAPSVQTSAAATDEHTIVSETLHMLAHAPAFKKSGNVLICLTREGLYNSLLNDLHRVQLRYPSETEIEHFVQVLFSHGADSTTGRCYGKLEPGLTEKELARIMRGLPLRDIEGAFREAGATKIPLSRKRVLGVKAGALTRDSEGTLSVMPCPITWDEIVGLEVVKRFFHKLAERLKAGDPASPRAVCMAGPPGTCKSSIAPLLALSSGFNIVKLENPKSMWLGESERRIRLALSIIENLSPAITFLDEVTETVPSRNVQTDGGVSADLLAQLFIFFGRDDLRGRVLLLAASNDPGRLDPAWHDRFLFVPFLELLPNEMSCLFGTYERRITGATNLDPKEPELIEAAHVLHKKGTSPRRVFDVISRAILFSSSGNLTPNDLLIAAKDYTGQGNPMSVAYCSLTAVALASFRSDLPWSTDPKNYAYPWYLVDLVDKESGDIDREKLHKRIEEYRKYSNL